MLTILLCLRGCFRVECHLPYLSDPCFRFIFEPQRQLPLRPTYDISLNLRHCCGSLLCTGGRLRAVKRRGRVFSPRSLVSLISINQRRRDGVGGCSRASRQLGHADGPKSERERAIEAIAEPELGSRVKVSKGSTPLSARCDNYSSSRGKAKARIMRFCERSCKNIV